MFRDNPSIQFHEKSLFLKKYSKRKFPWDADLKKSDRLGEKMSRTLRSSRSSSPLSSSSSSSSCVITSVQYLQNEKKLKNDNLKIVEDIGRLNMNNMKLQLMPSLALQARDDNDDDPYSDKSDCSDGVNEEDGDSSDNNNEDFNRETRDKTVHIVKKSKSDLNLAKIRTKLIMIIIKAAISKKYPFLWSSKMSKSYYTTEILSNFVIRLPGDENRLQFLSANYEEENEMSGIIENFEIFDKDGNYSIQKLFKSFCEAIADPLFNEMFSGKLWNIADIIIITNKELNCKTVFDSHELENYEFLFIKSGAKISSIKADCYDDIKQKMITSLEICEGDSQDDYGKYVLPFLQKIKYISFPSELEFNTWLDHELKDDIFKFLELSKFSSIPSDQTNFPNIDHVLTRLKVKARFIAPKKGRTLYNEMVKQINNLAHRELSRDYICKLKSYGLSFEQSFVDELKNKLSPDNKLIVLSTECTQLSLIKILQHYKSWSTIKTSEWLHDNDFIFVNSDELIHCYETEKIIKESFYSDQCPNLLLIECVSMNVSSFVYIIGTCTEWQEYVTGKQVIIIIEDKYDYECVDLFRLDENIHIISDENISFKHLTEDIQKNILEKKEDYIDRLTEREFMRPKRLWQYVTENTFNRHSLSSTPSKK